MVFSSHKVILTGPLPKSAIDRCTSLFSEFIYPENNQLFSREQLIDNVQGVSGILSMLTQKIDREIIEAAGPSLKVISNYAVGFDNIDIAYATEKGITVTNTPGVLTDATADLAWALLMSVSRRIVEADSFVRQKLFTGWEPLLYLGGDLVGKTLGIIGAGRIGTAMAQRSLGWNMKILYTSRRKNDALEQIGGKKVDLHALLRESDFVSLHLPFTKETHHLLDEQTLGMMKPTAYLINTARGAIIHERALIDALKMKKIAGAGLDVFEFEPKVTEELLTLADVVVAPHIGSATVETRTRMANIAVDNLQAVLQGKRPLHVVNAEVWN